MSRGASCAETLSPNTRDMSLDEFLDFLEPQEEKIDDKGNVLAPARGGAICQSASDWNRQKTALEQACNLLGKSCSYEMREVLQKVTTSVDTLQAKVSVKKEESIVTAIFAIPASGSVGDHVTALQKALKTHGFNPGTVDGIFGPKTLLAVSEFQKSLGLPGSGIIGPKTLQGLGLQVVPLSPAGAAITRDLKGRKARYLHPTLRLLIEGRVFPGGKIPECFKNRDLVACVQLISKAMAELEIREVGGNNKGEVVGLIQAVIGPHMQNGTGDAWCMSAVQCGIALIEDFFQVESPVLDSEHCVTTWNHAKKIAGLHTQECEAGSIWIAQNGSTTSGHTGFVIRPVAGGKMDTAEGNTGSGSIRDGDGFYLRTRNQAKNGDLKTLGFVRLYVDNVVA